MRECPHCRNNNTVHSKGYRESSNGRKHRWKCCDCGKAWQTDAEYESVDEVEEFGTVKQFLINLLKRGPQSIEDLSNELKILPNEVRQLLSELEGHKYNIVQHGDNIEISSHLPVGAKHKLDHKHWQGELLKIGFTSDNHLGSHYERLDVLNCLYDLFQDEGVSLVLNGGNWIDGETTFNKFEIHARGLSEQIEYAVENYPYREGVETKFVAGDDHEGWYTQREKINIGEYFQMKREQAGMFDLEYLGYMEADMALYDEKKVWLRLMHGGGGSAYATSYVPQKIVESYQGGDKPQILMLGHYHKLDYSYPREVHVIQMGCTQDQTKFMRKKKLQAHIGGGILEIYRAPDNTINRVKMEFITFYDRGFYRGKDAYLK